MGVPFNYISSELPERLWMPDPRSPKGLLASAAAAAPDLPGSGEAPAPPEEIFLEECAIQGSPDNTP
jgi:hypothetical protein